MMTRDQSRDLSQEHMRSVLDHVLDGIISIDQQGAIHSFNLVAENLFGYTQAEVIGRNLRMLLPAPHHGEFDSYLQTRETTTVGSRLVSGQRKDGSVFPMELDVNEFSLEGRRYFTGIIRDVSDRVNEEARMRAIFENVPDSIIMVDNHGLIQSLNLAAEEMTGYSAVEIIGQPLNLLTPEEQRPQMVALLDRMFRGKQSRAAGLELLSQRKDGSIFPIDLSLNAFVLGGEHYVIGVSRDATERRDREARLRAILDNASDAIITVDEAGLMQSFNRAAESNFGYGEVEMVGQPIYLLAAEDQREFFRDTVGRMCRGEQAQELGIEATGLRKDGSTFSLDISLSEFSLEDHRYVICISHDATQRKKLEEQLRQSQKMEAIGRLAGGVAHDFNNMLAVINAYSEMSLRKLPAENPLHEYLNEILHAGERAALITRQLLAFSRQQVLAPRVLDLNQVVRETEKMLQRLIGEDISIETTLEPELNRILVDQGQIVQVIMNLAVNARDAMPQGGKLMIRSSNFQVDEERARLSPDNRPGPHVQLIVSDTGTGMTPEVRQRIFEPFFTTKGPGQGTGLGLATVYGIIKQSGGHIEVYSEPDHGTTFTIYFPAVEQRGEPRGLATAAAAEGGSETILIVEDDDDVRKVAVVVLAELGYKLLVANRGRKALELVESHPGEIDLLLTDLIMPEMSGRQVAEAVVVLLPGIKVLYMSGYTDDAVVRHGLATETVAFLQKPFTSTSLGAKVREVLDARAPAGSSAAGRRA
jgi:PAS domain S-box-containing protein